MKSYFNFITYFLSIIGIMSIILIATGTISLKKNKYSSMALSQGMAVLNQENGKVYYIYNGKITVFDIENSTIIRKELE